jgi:hypothetical protein
MWERTDRSARPAREFAEAHGLDYSPSVSCPLFATSDALPFTGESLRHRVSGQWRGRSVQRFETGRYTVEMMQMPGPLPTLHVIPAGLDYRALAIDGRAIATGDVAFDSRWFLVTDDENFAAAWLTPGMREALMHPAADGRAISLCGDQVSTWAPGEGTWSEARVRLEFLAVIVGRISPDVRQRFEVSPPAPVAEAPLWVPEAEEREDVPMWAVAPMPAPVDSGQGADLSDTGEFEVALLNAELDGTTFIPEPIPAAAEFQGSWLYAPAVN